MPQRKISRSFSESYPLLSPRSDHLAEHHEHGYRDHAKQGVHQCCRSGGLAISAVKFGSPQSPQKDAPAPAESAPAATVRSRSREEMRAEYERMKAELNSILGRMTPPPGSTPQQQRNYYSARNIPVLKKIRVKVAWICNFCGCWHNDPDECVRPDLKGRWIYDDKIVIEHKEL